MVNIVQDFVRVNKYTRPGNGNNGIRGIVMHWTATPGATALNERNYFNGTCIEEERYASAHYFVDKNEIRQIIPEDEVAYHAHDRSRCYVDFLSPDANYTAIGIEMCTERDETIHDAVVAKSAELAADICSRYGFGVDRIVRHYDVTGKDCPSPWVSDDTRLDDFRNQVQNILNGGGGGSVTHTNDNSKPEPFIPANNGIIGRVKVIIDGLNIRVAPDVRADINRVAYKGEVFDVYANVNDWHNVGGANWVFGNNGKYLSLVSNGIGTVTVTASALNVRTGPGVGYNIVRTVSNGDSFDVHDSQNGWYCIGDNEWVSGKYVSFSN